MKSLLIEVVLIWSAGLRQPAHAPSVQVTEADGPSTDASDHKESHP